MAAQLNQPPSCAAQTGLEGDPAQGFYAPVTTHAGCYNYAQGGARVTESVVNSKAIEPELGFLTVPVATQIQHHLARVGGSFAANELVFVLAGGNDFLAIRRADRRRGGRWLSRWRWTSRAGRVCPLTRAAVTVFRRLSIMPSRWLDPYSVRLDAMTLAGTQLAALVNDQILARARNGWWC